MNGELEHYRILLVEDDAPLASMVVDFLSPHGFAVSIEGRGDTESIGSSKRIRMPSYWILTYRGWMAFRCAEL